MVIFGLIRSTEALRRVVMTEGILTRHRLLRALLIVLGYGMLFVVLDTQTLLFEGAPGTRIWAPLAGLNLALLVLFGLSYLPALLLITLAGGSLLGDPSLSPFQLVASSLIVVLGTGVAAVWLRRVMSAGPLRPLRMVGWFVGVALGLAVVVSGFTVLSATVAGQAGYAWETFASTTFRRGIGEIVGVLTLTPLLMLAVGGQGPGWVKEALPETTFLPAFDMRAVIRFGLEIGSIALAVWGAFFWVPGDAQLYACLFPLLWIAWRHGLARAVLAVFLLNLSMVLVLHMQGATAVGSVQVFMVALALLGLFLGALASERARILASLDQAHDILQTHLEKQTHVLEKARRDLDAQHDERSQVEETLKGSVEVLQASRDELQTVIQHEAELNEKLRVSERQLRDLNARKDKFFSIISHDVKSMLVSAIGFSKLLISDAETLPRDMIKEFASHVHSSATNTYDLLENLLTWTRMQTGRMYYQRAWHGVSELIKNNITMLKDNAARKSIVLKQDTNGDAQIYADRNMINSVLQNLISNAIKFTEHGGEVTVCTRAYDHTIEIAVTDTGVGIKPEDQEKLFRIDIHYSSTGTDDEEGTGLGLVLCKEMIEKHEGRIWVESEVGKGSSFFFTLPCAETAPQEA